MPKTNLQSRSVMPRPEILGNKDEIQGRTFFFLQVWMHMTTSYRDHTDRNGRLYQPSEQPTNLQTPQPPKPQQGNIRDWPT